MTSTGQIKRSSLLLTLVLCFTLAACRGEAPNSQAEAPGIAPAKTLLAVQQAEDEMDLTDESLYVLDATWSDQSGRPVQLASLRGKPVVLSMVFTRCGWACPMIVQDMKKIAARLPADVQDEIRYVLVTLDPERDTPEVLAGFARTHRLDAAQWTLLRGKASDVRLLAALLGVRYREEANGQFSHSNTITLLNSEGEIVHVQEGLGSDPTDTADKLRNLLADNS